MREELSGFFGRPVVRLTLGVLAAVAVASGLLWLIWIGYSYDWTGFNSYISAKGEPEHAKTLWNWLELLIVPTVLAVGALLFNRSERRAEREIADKRAQQDRDLASQRAQQDRDLASQRAQEVALQSYLDKMTELLLENGLREAEQGPQVQVIARARTLTALTGLDGEKRALLLGFLYEAALLGKGKAVIDLCDANLNEAALGGANLSGANLSGANLLKADLGSAVLSRADLSGAWLNMANLSEADLSEADLRGAFLLGADLSKANLRQANLRQANLRQAYLFAADLSGANLQGANLQGTQLISACLSRADLTSAIVNEEQLAQAKSLEGATMPDGTKHE